MFKIIAIQYLKMLKCSGAKSNNDYCNHLQWIALCNVILINPCKNSTTINCNNIQSCVILHARAVTTYFDCSLVSTYYSCAVSYLITLRIGHLFVECC